MNTLHPRPPSPITVVAPTDLRLIEQTKASLAFFRRLRQSARKNRRNGYNEVAFNLRKVQQIDYGSVSILHAIIDDLYENDIDITGILPDDETCRTFIADSGFLDKMHDEHDQPFTYEAYSESVMFDAGSGTITRGQIKMICCTLQNAVAFLTGKPFPTSRLKAVVFEICNNTVEWSGTRHQKWLMGLKYEDEKVIFTITDIGQGILKTLPRKLWPMLSDLIGLRAPHQILYRAFEHEYGSSSGDRNRNKGLPTIKAAFDAGFLRDLKVITNNAVLHFDAPERSFSFRPKQESFRGTFYQWELNADSFTYLKNHQHESN